MIPLMQQMTRDLRDHGFKGLSLEEHIFDNERHISVVVIAFNQM